MLMVESFLTRKPFGIIFFKIAYTRLVRSDFWHAKSHFELTLSHDPNIKYSIEQNLAKLNYSFDKY